MALILAELVPTGLKAALRFASSNLVEPIVDRLTKPDRITRG
jgi:hypothetical protein